MLDPLAVLLRHKTRRSGRAFTILLCLSQIEPRTRLSPAIRQRGFTL